MVQVFGFLYSLTVEPIEYILETAFCYFRSFFSGQASIPMAIAAVSMLVNLLTLPIYNAADARQLEERELQKRMAGGVAHIKAAFSGDERFLMLSEYYRQNRYSPVYALRGALSILVQVPFFMAAYNFLSNCPELAGVGLGPIKDLKEPDSLLAIGSLRLNLLPVLMTAINLVSGAIYTRTAPAREKIQVYGLALLFLVLLYGSPSGLVFYWTLNNLFSLAKNFVQGRRNPLSWVKALFCLALVAFCLYMAFFKPHAHMYKKLVLYACTLAVCLACAFSGRWAGVLVRGRGTSGADMKLFDRVFVASCLGLLLLVGGTVPLCVLGSDPVAFSFLEGYSSPFRLYWPTLVKAAGLFLLWPLFIYKMSAGRVRKGLSALSAILFFSALLNFYAFSGDYGILSDLLVYERDNVFDTGGGMFACNLLLLVAVACLVVLAMRKRLLKPLFFTVVVLNVAVAGHSLVEAGKTKRGYDTALSVVRRNETNSSVENLEPIFTLSRTGKNVFCIMLDRATGAYLEECFREDPKLYEQYDGFTFYPNTVSFGVCTVSGFPGLYGGYEYVPVMMNLKDASSMNEKFEEATSLLPRIFARNGYSVVVTDIPTAQLTAVDVDFYFMDSYPEKIKTLETEGIIYANMWGKEHGFGASSFQLEINNKRFLSYSVLRGCPVFVRSKLYEEGSYLISFYKFDEAVVSKKLNGDKNVGVSLDSTIKSYSVLDYLPELTHISDEGDNFVFMANQLTHSPNILQTPEYIPSLSVTLESPSTYAVDTHYYVNMAALKLLGEWLEYLKKSSAYDNTRIVISSDHGCGGAINVGKYSCLPKGEFACLLLVKDFDSHGRIEIDDSFMTNADVPSIAVRGLIDTPVNPATSNDITKIVFKNLVYGECTEWNRHLKSRNEDVFYIGEDTWYSVHDDIFTAENWGKPSSAEVYEETRKVLESQNIVFAGGAK
ncbi:MAG: YidC/Oxa1 family membrane protein insertase [Treponema sp.]|nr:YidC/Oxa1 family membrane protein insertase [Treponema sp.]